MNAGRVWSSGFIAAMALESLFQDFLGKARWIRMESDGWVTAWVTVPIAVAALLWSLWLRGHAGDAS